MCLEAVLIVGNSLGVDSLGKIGKSRVIDPLLLLLLLLLLLVAVCPNFFLQSCHKLPDIRQAGVTKSLLHVDHIFWILTWNIVNLTF